MSVNLLLKECASITEWNEKRRKLQFKNPFSAVYPWYQIQIQPFKPLLFIKSGSEEASKHLLLPTEHPCQRFVSCPLKKCAFSSIVLNFLFVILELSISHSMVWFHLFLFSLVDYLTFCIPENKMCPLWFLFNILIVHNNNQMFTLTVLWLK